MNPLPGALFDVQASSFDLRAGLPVAACASIAAAIIELGGRGSGGRVLDVGAGTGEIGLEVVRAGIGYVGFDTSESMLEVFRARALAEGLVPSLIRADARDAWPADDASVTVVFGSRSLHWLEAEHVTSEGRRVAARDGAILLVGRVLRDPEGPRERIRRAMRAALREAGYEGRSGRRSAVDLLAECVQGGAEPIPERVVATWSRARPARAAIDDWQTKPGLAGRDVPEEVKRAVLERTLDWTAREFGNIDAPLESEERYTLEGAVLTRLLAGPTRADP